MNEDAETSVDSLRSIMEEEAEKRKLTRLRNMGCSSQFSGAFTRLTMVGCCHFLDALGIYQSLLT